MELFHKNSKEGRKLMRKVLLAIFVLLLAVGFSVGSSFGGAQNVSGHELNFVPPDYSNWSSAGGFEENNALYIRVYLYYDNNAIPTEMVFEYALKEDGGINPKLLIWIKTISGGDNPDRGSFFFIKKDNPLRWVLTDIIIYSESGLSGKPQPLLVSEKSEFGRALFALYKKAGIPEGEENIIIPSYGGNKKK